jgi:hypothetical protein
VEGAGLSRVALAGFATGAAYMTKASTIPFFAIVAAMLAIEPGWAKWRTGIARSAVYAVSAILPVIHYLGQSRARYGHWMYNVNSYFYFWYDSWAQAKAGTRAFGDRMGWPDMPAGEVPSLGWYLARHHATDIAVRLLRGGAMQIGLLLLFSGLVLWIVPFSRLRLRMFRTARDWSVVILIVAYFGLFSWWMAMVVGTRSILPILVIGVVELWARVRSSVDPEYLYGCSVIWFLTAWPLLALFSFAGN